MPSDKDLSNMLTDEFDNAIDERVKPTTVIDRSIAVVEAAIMQQQLTSMLVADGKNNLGALVTRPYVGGWKSASAAQPIGIIDAALNPIHTTVTEPDYREVLPEDRKNEYEVIKRRIRLNTNSKSFMMLFEPKDDITMKEYMQCVEAIEGRIRGSVYRYLIDFKLIRHFTPED